MNKAEKAKAYREELKAEGYCPRCYKRKAVAGKLHCKECEKYYYAYYHAHKAQRLEYAKQRREKLKAAGLCTQCGKRQQEKGLLCIECYKKLPINTSKQGVCPAFFILRFFKKRLDNRMKGGYNISKR